MNNIINQYSHYEDWSVPVIDLNRGLDYITQNEIQPTINLCAKKLMKGGVLRFKILHLSSFFKEYLFGSPPEIDNLFGLRSVNNIELISQILHVNNMRIINARIDRGIYCVEAMK